MAGEKLRALAQTLPPLPERLLAGVSGGADSVALLRLLVLSGRQVQAVHVNHGLRGDASDGDEAFVRALCREMDVPLMVYRAVPPAHAGEGWAREARYGFFREAMAQTNCEALALAHHQDDQAETLLLHLLRGAGLTGLCGMAPDAMLDGMRVVRPLLSLTRAQLQEALLDADQPWREDASNADDRYLRNALRHRLLPEMERLVPGASQRLARTALLLRAEEDDRQSAAEAFLHQYAGRYADQCAGGMWLRLRPLMAQTSAMQSRILRTWWQQAAGSSMEERWLDYDQTAALLRLVPSGAGAKCNLPGGWHGVRGWQCLHLVSPEPTAQDMVPMARTAQEIALPGPTEQNMVSPAQSQKSLGGVTLLLQAPRGTPGDGRMAQELPEALLDGCVLRFRRPGDWIRPFGGGRKRLQDYLIDKRVDAPFRHQVPLLCRGSEVLLAAGVGAGDIPPLNHNTRNIRAVWQGDMPWARED